MHPAKKVGNSLASAIALVVLAAIPAALSYYVFSILLNVHSAPDAHPSNPRIRGRAMLLGIALAGVALFLLLAAAKSILWGFSKPQPDRDFVDDSWKDMPYPKG